MGLEEIGEVYSKMGFDFNGNVLSELTLSPDATVLYDGQKYKLGNMRNRLVELYKDDKFFKTVSTLEISLVGEGYISGPLDGRTITIKQI